MFPVVCSHWCLLVKVHAAVGWSCPHKTSRDDLAFRLGRYNVQFSVSQRTTRIIFFGLTEYYLQSKDKYFNLWYSGIDSFYHFQKCLPHCFLSCFLPWNVLNTTQTSASPWSLCLCSELDLVKTYFSFFSLVETFCSVIFEFTYEQPTLWDYY